MSAATSGTTPPAVRRLLPRYNLAVPVDVTVLRSGVPDTIPGRALNLSETGLGAVLAAELTPGQSVGVEMVLPQTALPIHLKAMVRHQEHLHCGVEFVALSGEQREVLHTWAKRVGTELPPLPVSMVEESLSSVEPLPRPASLGVRVPGHGKKLLAMIAFLAVITAGVTWWHWEKAWQELENRLMGAVVLPRSERLHVPPEIMQQRVLRRVAPMYPEEARSGNIAGVVVMQVAVGRDGNVLSVRPLSGPEILTPAATEAVRWWQFEPYLVKGQAVEVETTLGVEFQP